MKRLINVALAVAALLLGACSYAVEVDGIRHDVRIYPLAAPATDAPPATATPTPAASPTPTSTPAPPLTTTPTPETLPLCTGEPEPGLRVRDGVWGTIIGQFRADTVQTLRFEARQQDSAGAWWYAFWWKPGVYGWVHGDYVTFLEAGGCNKLPERPPVVRNKRGINLNVGAQMPPLSLFGNVKGTTGTESTIKAIRSARPDMLIVWRNLVRPIYGWGDCPPGWGQGDPVDAATQWWSVEYAEWQARGLLGVADYFEYRNECVFTGEWEIQFDRRMVALANRTGICLALFSDAYGNPRVAEFAQRKPVLDMVLATECQPGKHHLVAYHVYEGVVGGRWLIRRPDLERRALGSAYDALRWVITEYGYGDGRGAADCAAFAADDRLAWVYYAEREYVVGYQHFAMGAGPWTDVGRCLERLQ